MTACAACLFCSLPSPPPTRRRPDDERSAAASDRQALVRIQMPRTALLLVLPLLALQAPLTLLRGCLVSEAGSGSSGTGLLPDVLATAAVDCVTQHLQRSLAAMHLLRDGGGGAGSGGAGSRKQGGAGPAAARAAAAAACFLVAVAVCISPHPSSIAPSADLMPPAHCRTPPTFAAPCSSR